jgi:hypothetical protein
MFGKFIKRIVLVQKGKYAKGQKTADPYPEISCDMHWYLLAKNSEKFSLRLQ